MAGLVNTEPVNTDAPPVGLVYQSKTAFGTVDVAVNVAVCPEFTACIGGVTATSGPEFTAIVICALDGVEQAPKTPST